MSEKIRIDLGDKSYDITVGHGILSDAGKLFDLKRRIAIITDDNIPKQYIDAIKNAAQESTVIVFKAGEESKNLTTYANICKELITFGLQRQDAIVAVGGGVCTDIAGFCAATYMRGVDFYSVPTTTLAAADASVGGKTALDFLGNKNIIGAFLQPKGVLIDTATFMTLDKRQFRSGLVEIIKMAATSDAALFSDIENGLIGKDLTSAIKRGLMIKKAVVEADECETGLRRILNFGHTLGHGIESLGGLTHGECVALGMLPMCSAEVRERLINVLSGVGISTKAPEDIKNTFDFIKADKKASGDEIYTVFVDTIGDGKIEKISFSDLFCRIRNFK